MTPEDIARRFDNRAGYRVVAYGPVGLPVYRLTTIGLCVVRKALSPIEEFVLRGINARVETSKALAGFLGLQQAVVESCIAEFLRTDSVRSVSKDDGALYRLSPKGEQLVREQESAAPMEQTIVFCVDGLTRRPRFLHDSQLTKPKDLRDLGIPEVRANPPRPPTVQELDINDVIPVLRLDSGVKESPRMLLRLNSIERRDRRFIEAVALGYRSETGDDVQIAFVIDGRLAVEHEQAFRRAESFEASRLSRALRDRPPVPVLQDLLGQELAVRVEQIATSQSAQVEELSRAVRTERSQLRVARLQTIEDQGSAERLVSETSAKVVAIEQKIAESSVRPLAVYEHAALLNEALKKVRSRLLIVSPWIRRAVVDHLFIKTIEKAIHRGVRVHIGYGIGEVDEGERRWDADAKKELAALAERSNGKLTLRRLGDTHAKILIVDDTYFVISSFNWLSFRGDPGRTFREEWGTLVAIREIVDDFYQRMLNRFSENAL